MPRLSVTEAFFSSSGLCSSSPVLQVEKGGGRAATKFTKNT